MYRDTTYFDESQEEFVVTPQERERIKSRSLFGDDNNLSDFYIPETDEDREKNAPNLDKSDINEIRVQMQGVLSKNNIANRIKIAPLGAWFQNAIPQDPKEWEKSHVMTFEVCTCIQPIMNANKPVLLSWLQGQMQER